MSEITKALVKAFASLLHPRMLLLLLWPVAVAFALWLGLAYTFWSQAAAWLQTQFEQSSVVVWAIGFWPLSLLATHLAWILLVLLFVPLVLVTAVLIIGVFAMPAMVEHVAQRDYAQLERRRGGSFAGSLGNSLMALVWLALIVLLTLPLWFIPLLWPILPVLYFGYLNQRVMRYDALAEHASAWELRSLIGRDRIELFLLGVAVGLVGLVPLLGLFAPVYGCLAFIHYGLARLAQLREDPVATQT